MTDDNRDVPEGLPEKHHILHEWMQRRPPGSALRASTPSIVVHVISDALDDLAAAHREIEELREDAEYFEGVTGVPRGVLATVCRERDLAVEALEDVLLVLGTPREVNIGTPCWRYECTFAQHKTNPIEQARTALAKLKGGENG